MSQPNFLGHMLVSDKYKMIIHVMPKCACTYIIRWVSQLEGYFDDHGHSLLGNKCNKYGTVHLCSWNTPQNKLFGNDGKLTPEGIHKVSTYHTVFIVRNPFDRLVSFYLANHRKDTFKDMIVNKLIKCNDLSNIDHVMPLANSKCFSKEYDTYIRFDHLEKDFNELRTKLNITEPFVGMGINNKTGYVDFSNNGEDDATKFSVKNLKSHHIDPNVTYCGDMNYCDLSQPFPRWPSFYDGSMEGSLTRQIIQHMYKADFQILENIDNVNTKIDECKATIV